MQKLANLVRASYSYDSADRLTTLANVKSNGTYVSRYDYAYDNTMNKTRVIEANDDRVTWSYDNSYQLTREQRSGTNAYDTTYVYDQAQNRKLMIDSGSRTTYTCDVANQLNWLVDGTGRTTFAYDQNGNQTLELVPALTRTTNVWDGENRLVQVMRSNTERSTYTYKGENNLRIVAEEPSAPSHKIIWDGQAYFEEANALNVTQATYTNEPRAYGNLLSQKRGPSSFYHSDGEESVAQLSDGAMDVTDTYLYNMYGVTFSVSGSTINPFRFGGIANYYTDSPTGYIYLRYGWYAPSTARWLSIAARVSLSDSIYDDASDIWKKCYEKAWSDMSKAVKECYFWFTLAQLACLGSGWYWPICEAAAIAGLNHCLENAQDTFNESMNKCSASCMVCKLESETVGNWVRVDTVNVNFPPHFGTHTCRVFKRDRICHYWCTDCATGKPIKKFSHRWLDTHFYCPTCNQYQWTKHAICTPIYRWYRVKPQAKLAIPFLPGR